MPSLPLTLVLLASMFAPTVAAAPPECDVDGRDLACEVNECTLASGGLRVACTLPDGSTCSANGTTRQVRCAGAFVDLFHVTSHVDCESTDEGPPSIWTWCYVYEYPREPGDAPILYCEVKNEQVDPSLSCQGLANFRIDRRVVGA